MRDAQYGQRAGSADTVALACHTCDPVDRPVRMVLSARQGVRQFNAELPRVPGNGGFVLARIQNIDSVTFADLRLAAGDSAFWWWGRNANREVQSYIYLLGTDGTPRDSILLGVSHCRLPQQPADSAQWNKDHAAQGCPPPPTNNSFWVSCLNGCCSGSAARR